VTTARRGGVVSPPASARSGLAGAVYAGARRFVPSRAKLPVTESMTGTSRRLLLVALELFAAHGFYGVSMRDLAAALEIKPASLYNHVPSKEKLLADLVLLGHRTHAEAIGSRMAEAGADPVDRLDAFVRAHVEVHAIWSMLSVVTNNELHAVPAELAEPSLQIRQETSQLLVDILEEGVQAGAFLVPDTLLVAAAIGAMGMRVATWFDGDGTHTVEQVSDTYALLVRRMVGVGTSGAARASEASEVRASQRRPSTSQARS
jgi:AcrR family transcriptional regulator